MTELGAVFIGIIIGVILMLGICVMLYVYAKILNKIRSFKEWERKAHAVMKERAQRKYDELNARISTLEKNMKTP
ncbi:MAG: hypothetical protein II395_10315 [Ruminococcus sp.]|nr:hypothetical protein [Ruminococcus sp.]